LRMVQLIPLPSQNPIVSCLISVQTGFTFMVPSYPGCPGKEVVKGVTYYNYNYYHLTASFPGHLGKPVPER